MDSDAHSWPFDQQRNCATFTTRQIIDGSEKILEAYHDADDHGWQFIGATGGSAENCVIVGLEEIVSLDRTVLEVADLPPGWRAVRSAPTEPWARTVNVRELTEEEFLKTFSEPMRQLEATESYRPIPLKDYLSECIRTLDLPTTPEHIEIHHVYLSGNKKYSHVLFYFGEPNQHLVIVVSHETDSVEGYRVLDLAKEYGLKS